MITQESRFAEPQNQAGLLSNKTMQQNTRQASKQQNSGGMRPTYCPASTVS